MMMHLLGYFGAILIGISMGLIGGGGTILTVPVLVYVFHILPVTASGYSMFIVGATSLSGSISYIRRKLIDFRITAMFGIPALVMVFITRKFILHALPAVFFTVGNYSFTKDEALMTLFALLMLLASYAMLFKKKYPKEPGPEPPLIKEILGLGAQGLVIGLLGGLLGAGGGFLIVPALVLFAHMEVKKAIGTSLMIISINLLLGFLAVVTGPIAIDWPFVLTFSALSVSGIVLGGFFSKYIPGEKLKPAFGIFIFVLGIYILIKELK